MSFDVNAKAGISVGSRLTRLIPCISMGEA